MKNSLLLLFILLLVNSNLFSQEVKEDVKKKSKVDGTEKVNVPYSITDQIKFKNETGNAIITITDEGSNAGSIFFPAVGSALTGTKLYNFGGNLYWGGSQLNAGSGASSIDALSDAIFDGTSLYIGEGAGITDEDGTNGTIGIGVNSLRNNLTGTDNVSIGNSSLYNNSGGFENTTLGNITLYSNTSGYQNIAIGYEALYSNITGFHNTANGYKTLYSNTTGSSNTANGSQALFNNTTGFFNTANGSQALFLNTVGIQNTAIGHGALYSNVANSYGVAIGFESQKYAWNSSNSVITGNTSVGYQSLRGSTNPSSNTGYSNSAFGYQALYTNTTGSYNTANGRDALSQNTSGSYNTANGFEALPNNTEGNYNTAIGYSALVYNTTGSNNSALGFGALFWSQTGDFNTGVGYDAGPNSFIPYSNTTALGKEARPTASNTVVIGNTAITSIKGNVAFSTFSDGRYKRNVQEDVAGIDFIMGLRPVTYNLEVELLANKLQENIRIDKDGKKTQEAATPEISSARAKRASVRNSGFIAQEVESLANSLGYEFSGVEAPQNEESMYALRYAEFVVPLVKAVQEQQVMIGELRKEIEEMKLRN